MSPQSKCHLSHIRSKYNILMHAYIAVSQNNILKKLAWQFQSVITKKRWEKFWFNRRKWRLCVFFVYVILDRLPQNPIVVGVFLLSIVFVWVCDPIELLCMLVWRTMTNIDWRNPFIFRHTNATISNSFRNGFSRHQATNVWSIKLKLMLQTNNCKWKYTTHT